MLLKVCFFYSILHDLFQKKKFISLLSYTPDVFSRKLPFFFFGIWSKAPNHRKANKLCPAIVLLGLRLDFYSVRYMRSLIVVLIVLPFTFFLEIVCPKSAHWFVHIRY